MRVGRGVKKEYKKIGELRDAVVYALFEEEGDDAGDDGYEDGEDDGGEGDDGEWDDNEWDDD